MKLSKGKANPGLLNKILLEKLNAKSWCFCWWVSISIYILSQENEKCMQLYYSWHNSCQLPSLKLVSPWVGLAFIVHLLEANRCCPSDVISLTMAPQWTLLMNFISTLLMVEALLLNSWYFPATCSFYLFCKKHGAELHGRDWGHASHLYILLSLDWLSIVG